MSDELSHKKCVPCESGIAPLGPEQAVELLGQIKNWTSVNELALEKEFSFKDFSEALSFINKVGVLAESEGHHPDMLLHDYKKVRISLSTHAIGGLSENDFILASKIDNLN